MSIESLRARLAAASPESREVVTPYVFARSIVDDASEADVDVLIHAVVDLDAALVVIDVARRCVGQEAVEPGDFFTELREALDAFKALP